MRNSKDTWTSGHDDVAWRRRDTVEFWMSDGSGRRSVWVDKDRLFVLGMKTYPEVVDLTQISPLASQVLEQLLTGHRRYFVLVSMNQCAEICHVAQELKFQNLLKLVEKDLVGQRCGSMEQTVDSLTVAIQFGMADAVEKLVDEIIFGFSLDEQFLIYCKNGMAVDMVLNRKAELEGYGGENSGPRDEQYLDPGLYEDLGPQENPRNQNQNQIAIPQAAQNAHTHKILLNAAKERFRTFLNRPINSVKNGIASWRPTFQNSIGRQAPDADTKSDSRNHQAGTGLQVQCVVNGSAPAAAKVVAPAHGSVASPSAQAIAPVQAQKAAKKRAGEGEEGASAKKIHYPNIHSIIIPFHMKLWKTINI
ncbi:hypothetical protein L5515_000312 [Caenorhabditis briggsae]|uniref:Uncharacterized protein n=1 Tax=Caenorhabditis briggsae TaxID=6238 RepID=A0AAE9E157_CAEBR|nr:hypothetical protein L5515_000312 [Caenorhabditis briggsae]